MSSVPCDLLYSSDNKEWLKARIIWLKEKGINNIIQSHMFEKKLYQTEVNFRKYLAITTYWNIEKTKIFILDATDKISQDNLIELGIAIGNGAFIIIIGKLDDETFLSTLSTIVYLDDWKYLPEILNTLIEKFHIGE